MLIVENLNVQLRIKRDYLSKLESLGLEPNFFMSLTYISQESIKARINNSHIWLEEDGLCLFPKLPLWRKLSKVDYSEFWAGFPMGSGDEFLDFNYIYNPKLFLEMNGGRWATFRKNCRKFPKRNMNVSCRDSSNYNAVSELILAWALDHSEDAEDAEFLVDVLMEPRKGDYLKYFYKGETLVGINYADYNYKYINYRFLICLPLPYLDEYMRYKFYTDPTILNKNMLVNDGGTLGRKALERFKDKLNPILKTKVYTKF